MASASRNSTPACAARPGSHHDRHRRCQAERTRTGDDQHRHRVDHGIGPGRVRPEYSPGQEASAAKSPTLPVRTRNSTLSAMRCMGARERCACATNCTICASTVSDPTLSARITRAPTAIDRGADHFAHPSPSRPGLVRPSASTHPRWNGLQAPRHPRGLSPPGARAD